VINQVSLNFIIVSVLEVSLSLFVFFSV